ncbi:AraC-type DNA-binding protein [Tenacibaculum sp. MAR_2009_124]|uniref:helix-turn-helix domain-containing protein n=1 Tax=Tenacibaculum sp. MAR_2009_124 TaxID=1250059 RepID=UPI0008993384|nr:helix-turn-helix domain-containing protein [Tenacibaculum sp. MAR_2009_124]SED15848.1 AraC-type DNA-binding protein [Tenacibaculum sp. MAR_2009_124]
MNFKFQKTSNQSEFIITDFSDISYKKFVKSNNYFKILWVKKDNSYFIIDGYKIDLNKNCLVFCTPENQIDLKDNTNQEILAFIFNREFYCIRDHDKEVSCNGLLFYGSSLPTELKLSQLKIDLFNMYYIMLEEEFMMNDSLQGEMLRTILKQILILSTRLMKQNLNLSMEAEENVDLIRSFNLLVEQHFKTKHKVKEYAEILNKSPKTLTNVFNSNNYKTPSSIITDRIILETQRLLTHSDKNISEIAFELGFSSSSHFSKFIKKHKGMSPVLFKNNLLQNS